MLSDFYKIAYRNIFRHKLFATINIFGLVIGFTVSILIILYVINELSYDRFHDDANNIYRVSIQGKVAGQEFNYPLSPSVLAQNMVIDFNEVKHATGFREFNESFFSYNDLIFKENKLLYADTSFFDVFSFRLIHGDKNKALSKPFSMVIDQGTSQKYFGNKNPIGDTLICNSTEKYCITGVVENVPNNSHFNFNALISFSTINIKEAKKFAPSWTSLSFYTYIKLKSQTNVDEFSVKISDYITKKEDRNLENFGIYFNTYLQPITRIHLHSNLNVELAPNSNIKYVYVLIMIVALILGIACINFMNLSTGRFTKRAREVAIRKVLGSGRKMLFAQFVIESILLSLIALLFSLMFVELLLPWFNLIIDKELAIKLPENPKLFLGFVLLALLTGIVAGSYPAVYLSAFTPTNVFKGKLTNKYQNTSLRGLFVSIQFSISICLIACTMVIHSQLNYIKNKQLGFDTEKMYIIPLSTTSADVDLKKLKQKLLEVPEIESVSLSSGIPCGGLSGSAYIPEGRKDKETWLFYKLNVDYDYIETLNIKLIEGRNFDKKIATDTSAIIINQTLANHLGWKNAIGKKFDVLASTNDSSETYNKYEVIGIFKDFHNQSLHQKILPMLFHLTNDDFEFISVKLKNNEEENILNSLKTKWNETLTEKLYPKNNNHTNKNNTQEQIKSDVKGQNIPFDYFSINDYINDFYKEEQKQAKIFISFTIVAILIALLGLFGLAIYISEQRTKEIGIRKVTGASCVGIIWLLSKEYIKWVLLSNVFAWPMAWYSMKLWLENFEYKVEPNFIIFPLSGFTVLFISIIVTSGQALKTSRMNPTKALKHE